MTAPTLAALRQELIAEIDARLKKYEAEAVKVEEPPEPFCGWTQYVGQLRREGGSMGADWITWAQPELSRLRARVAELEKAQAEEEEPPALTDPELSALCGGGTMPHTKLRAAARLRYVEPELSRLRKRVAELEKAQEMQPGDCTDGFIHQMAIPLTDSTSIARMAREIARHRGLKVTP